MDEQPHRRRVRYNGTHPHRFEEKYKELDAEKYPEDVEKIARSGRTPAGTHVPICVREILEFLDVQPGQTGWDATLGYGGHAQELLKRLDGRGHLYATDVDPIEAEKTVRRLAALGYGPQMVTAEHLNFARAEQVAPGVLFDFVLADLGVSSMQLDNPERGFTYKYDGPLDLRMDPTAGEPASARLASLSEEELEGLLSENADEPYAHRIARAVADAETRGIRIVTTRQLAQIVANAVAFLPPAERKEEAKKACQRTFQALRVDVNGEFEALYAFLEKLPSVLKSGGRAAILTFPSGEDRLVKRAFKEGVRSGVYREAARDVIRPSEEECFANPRAKPAKLRWAVRA